MLLTSQQRKSQNARDLATLPAEWLESPLTPLLEPIHAFRPAGFM